MLNVGYIEGTRDGVVVRIYYDATAPIGDQPLINGPRGYCLDLTNLTGANARLVVTRADSGATLTVNVGQGDPVVSGPAQGRSRTVADLNSQGFRTRGDVGHFSI